MADTSNPRPDMSAELSLSERERGMDFNTTPTASTRAKRTRANAGATKGAPLTLRDQEKQIDHLKKENFDLKLRLHFFEDRLHQMAPEQMETVIKQNITLKTEVQSRGMEIKKLKKVQTSLQREVDKLSRGAARERELEEKLEERDMELQELRRRRSGHSLDDFALREAEARNAELEEQLDSLKGLLEENTEEIERLQELLERKADESTMSEGGQGRRERMKRRVEDLEAENENIRERLEEHVDLLTRVESERDDALDRVEELMLELETERRRRQAESMERSQSRAQILDEIEDREVMQENLNALKDRLAAVTIELTQREDDLELRNRELEEMAEDHTRDLEDNDHAWRSEIVEMRNQKDNLADVLAEREAAIETLRVTIAGFQAEQDNIDEALKQLEEQIADKDNEILNLNKTIDSLHDQLYQTEDEADHLKEAIERMQEDEDVEKQVSAALKEKIAALKAELEETSVAYEALHAEALAHRQRQEQLAHHSEDLDAQLCEERRLRERAVADLDAADREHEEEMRRERRAFEAKESALQSALNDLARTQSLLDQREFDLQAVQTALQTIEAESKRAGETHTTARFSLQLEVDRLKRDLERLEDELARARKDLEDKDSKGRDRDGVLDRLHAENRDLATQLAAQTQARLNVTEKLDTTQASLKAAEAQVATFRSRIADLEERLSKDQRSLLAAENQYRDQLTERNTLLLTIYQYMDKILGVDKTPKKGGQAETKPFTNFSVFHDNLITRLKALSQIQLDFDKRCKEVESKFTKKLADMRKQLDHRWKQIDKFEEAVKGYADAKAAWRRKYSSKEGELEAIKATNADLTTQLAAMKKPGQSDAMEVRALSARATNAERRLINAQNLLAASEEKVAEMNQRNASADSKWEARVKEYEARLKAAEEKYKRERQGAKERVNELENNMKNIREQLELAQKRNRQLNDVVQTARTGDSPGNSSR
ncbi:hypothetical protein CCMSSC00406_0003108 [Pleurotus cornucopiae]|uniref:Uncharacterized protein n=1 Tax=Pleurotus cornucopiae TaxID=5321 RepID=A0ACB7J5R9_PLECO|nr:hypothetical protein CCMSSC00406_0003108 [Pleurotus cornucopiae]